MTYHLIRRIIQIYGYDSSIIRSVVKRLNNISGVTNIEALDKFKKR